MKFDFLPEEEGIKTAELKRILETSQRGNDMKMSVLRDEELGRSILNDSVDGV
jgi:hypothetical protein